MYLFYLSLHMSHVSASYICILMCPHIVMVYIYHIIIPEELHLKTESTDFCFD